MASVFFVKGTFLARSQQGRAGQARCGTVSYMIRSKKPVADIMCTLVVRYLLGIWVRYTKMTLVIFDLKGQLISKCLFGTFNSPKKRTKIFDFTTMVPQVELFSFVFWEN